MFPVLDTNLCFKVTETVTESVIENSVSRLIFEERVGQLHFFNWAQMFFHVVSCYFFLKTFFSKYLDICSILKNQK